jgi:hypothetical protein
MESEPGRKSPFNFRLVLLLAIAAAAAWLVIWQIRSNEQAQKLPPAPKEKSAEAPRQQASTPRLPQITAAGQASGTASRMATGKLVINSSWGAEPGQLGHRPARESNPEGPMSLAVSDSGDILVLDQVNQRVQRFAPDGTHSSSIPIGSSTAQDLTVDEKGRTLVLDRLGQPGVEVFDADGKPAGRLELLMDQVKEGGGITGLFTTDDGVYVEVENEDLVPVGKTADTSGTMPGRPTRDGRLFLRAGIIDRQSGRVYVQAHDQNKKLVWELPINLTLPVLHILLLDSDGQGRAYLGAEVGIEDPTTHDYSDLATAVVRISTKGRLDGSLWLPPSTSSGDESFRPLVVDNDGTLYHMVPSEQGVQVTTYTF